MYESKMLERLLAVNREGILALQKAIREALKGQCCLDCGEKDERTLVFHHVRGFKRFAISQSIKQLVSLKELKNEMAKCELRCSNCYLKKMDSGAGEHYYTSKAAIDKAIEDSERAVIKRYLRDVAQEALGIKEGPTSDLIANGA
jgi:hypothetical protein